MGKRTGYVAIAALLLQCVVPALADEHSRNPETPIMIQSTDLDACWGNGVVGGLDPDGDGFLSVRTSPGSKNEEIDRLHNGDPVYICAERGKWFGIVYTKAGQDCGVDSPWPVSKPYTGPCRSGWAHSDWIRNIAG